MDYSYYNRKFCSQICFYIDKKFPLKKLEKTCLTCGRKYIVRRYRMNISKYCSRICQHKSERKEFICKVCGKEFWVRNSRIKEGKGIYCSLACANKSLIRKEHCKKSALLAYKKPRKKPICMSPNKDEIQMDNIMKKLSLPYKYVGNGEVWIAGLNPDFININGQKKIVELFGEPWHGRNCFHSEKPSFSRTEEGRKKVFGEYGYDTLIVWCRELRQPEMLKQKLLNFEKNGGN